MAARFVMDNSVVMSWCFQEEGGSYTEAVLESLEGGEAYVLAVWPLEVGDVLLAEERKKRLSEASVIRFLTLVAGLSIMVEQESPERMLKEIVSLARQHGLSTYDASYLDLAMRLGLLLSTQDASLMKAAKKCSVPAYKPTRKR